MKIEVYLDTQTEPYTTFEPPESFRLDTTVLDDGEHTIRFKAIDTDGTIGLREVKFSVHNGPNISVHGLRDDDQLFGEVSILANAYSSKIGDIFEPMRIETPNPIPTWAWVLVLVVFSWSMWYLGTEYREHQANLSAPAASASVAAKTTSADSPAATGASWQALGKQVYENNCASCHQANGSGLAGLFPPLVANPSVLADDASEHLSTILNGAHGKIIQGISYPAPMPPFGSQLSDEEIAAVANHERTSWGNGAKTVTADEVTVLRK
ncbi:MAG TPA: cytochrome c [Woeseiaceae bacterium]|nr:cytochrome c [Woeseiaceae bacterium]